MVDRLVVSAARGASLTEIARQTGNWGVASTDTDGQALEKFADYAITQNPGFASDIPGPSNNTRNSLDLLKGASITDVSSLYDNFVWFWTPGNYAGLADDLTIVKSNDHPLTEGAWVKQPVISKKFAGAQDMIVAPAGNEGDTFASSSMQGVFPARTFNKREFYQVVSVRCSYGYGQGSTADKVTSYRSFIANPGCGDAWVDNRVFSHLTDDPINTHIDESDYDMWSDNKYGFDPGPNGLAGGILGDNTPFTGASAHGMVVTGLSHGSGYITTAFLAAAAGTNRLFSRGFANGVGSVYAGFFDSSDSKVAFDGRGVYTHTFSSKDAGYIAGAAFIMGQQHRFQALDTNGQARTLMYLLGNTLDIGHEDGIAPSSVSLVRFNTPVVPRYDNLYTLGTPSNRFSAVFAVNGQIQQSDPELKLKQGDISPSQGMRILRRLAPIRFRWKVGGLKARTIMVPGMVPEKDADGNLLTDTVIALDDAGEPIVHVPAKRIEQEDGSFIEKPAVYLYTAKPRMVMGEVAQTVADEVEGNRIHWGWDADNVRAAFEGEGDFGGYVLDEDGIKNLRPDQLSPVLCAAIQDLDARLKGLEAA